jgi:hypothetical protein
MFVGVSRTNYSEKMEAAYCTLSNNAAQSPLLNWLRVNVVTRNWQRTGEIVHRGTS